MATGKDAGTDVLPRIKGMFPGYIHKIGRASTAYTDHPTLGQGFHEAMAKLHCLLNGGRTVGSEVIRMDMHVPQPWQEIGPVQVDYLCVAQVGSTPALEHLHNPSMLHS